MEDTRELLLVVRPLLCFPCFAPSKVGLDQGVRLRGWPPEGGARGWCGCMCWSVCVCVSEEDLAFGGNLACLLGGILEI